MTKTDNELLILAYENLICTLRADIVRLEKELSAEIRRNKTRMEVTKSLESIDIVLPTPIMPFGIG